MKISLLYKLICGNLKTLYCLNSSLKIKKLCKILDVGRSRYKNFSDEKAEKVTSSWLRHSIDRLKRTAALT